MLCKLSKNVRLSFNSMAITKTKINRSLKTSSLTNGAVKSGNGEASRKDISRVRLGSTTNGSVVSKKSGKTISLDAAASKKALTLKAFDVAYKTHHRKAT